MNGNWGGIASRDFERIRDDHNDYDPSLDVINTIIASYAASNVDESEQKDNPPVKSKREQNYYYDDQQGLIPPQKSSTPKSQDRQVDRYVHPLALKLKMQDGRNHKDRHSSEAQSNAATDNESEHRSEGGESFTQTNHEVAHAIMEVTKKLQWATQQLGDITSIDGSINAVKLISECALTISNLKQARGKN